MTEKTIILSDDNYYSNEADWQFMSVSQYKGFQKCEAAQLAKLKEEWQPVSDPIALLVGNYVHSYFEDLKIHEAFKEEHKDRMFSKRKPYGLLKDFKIAEQMIDRLIVEDFFLNVYQGKKEEIVTGDLYGINWKSKIDCLSVEDGYFVDIKTTKDIHERKWNDNYNERATFIENYGYVLQMAVYKELLKQKYNKEFVPIIAAVSKQTPSEAKLITLDEDKMIFELILLKENIDHISKVKTGEEAPTYCGQCDYCRSVQRITSFTNMNDL